MEGHRRGDVVRVEGDARQRYFDSSGYGRPHAAGVDLAPVEAAHLLYRGDLDAVDGDGFRAYVADAAAADSRFLPRFLVYADLRERGFYLSPAREGWPGTPDPDDESSHRDADDESSHRDADDESGGRPESASGSDTTASATETDLTVFARGERPGGEVAYRVRVVGERTPVRIRDVPPATLAVVDEESEVSYFSWESGGGFAGATTFDAPRGVPARLLSDRVVCWDPPTRLYESGFFGQPVSGRDAAIVDALQLSLVEAAWLAERDTLALDAETVRERGRTVEGDRFDRRLAVYRDLRERGVVPKTGFKFGADFRTYDEVTSVEELSHSEALVRVVEPDSEIGPRELALDVRLAGGVRKRTVFGLATDTRTEYVTVTRLTP